MANEFAVASGRRVAITNAQRKQIKKLYASVLNDVSANMEFLKTRGNVSSVLRLQYLNGLKRELEASMDSVDRRVESTIRSNMMAVSNEVVAANRNLLKKMGFDSSMYGTAYSYVPRQMVNEIVTGQLYEGRWTLSRAIWKNKALRHRDLEMIIAKGVAENRSTYDIAKDLERYVNPASRKSWAWSKVYPGTRRRIDYNAQRLARTMISHAYEESFVRTTKNNPFIDAYKWLPSNSDRVCPLCRSRGEDDQFGLGSGIFPKDSLPLDHPNGMCTFEIVMTKSYEQIADSLADWATGSGNQKMNSLLDIFLEDLQDIY